jgi:hypothetical protein
MTPDVAVNLEKCKEVADALKRVSIPEGQEEFDLTGLDEHQASNFLLCSVAICHQTQGLSGFVGNTRRRGWDYLTEKLRETVLAGKFGLTPDSWRTVSAVDIEQVFGESLSDPEGRAGLIRDLAAVMLQQGWKSLHALYVKSGHLAVEGSAPLTAVLRHFRGYQDPVQKKSVFLIALLANCCGWEFRDLDRLPPPVDYHEIRGHLRLGTVQILSPALLQRLHLCQEVTDEEDVVIRSCVRDAILQIARMHGAAWPSTLHYLFWNIFRNLCLRDKPQCQEVASLEGLPLRYHDLVTSSGKPSCPFCRLCTAQSHKTFPVEYQRSATIWY